MQARYEIQIASVPRCYRDVLETAIEAAGFLKVRNLKEEVKLIDLENRKWMLFKDDYHTPEWREPIWEPAANAKPIG